MDKRLIKLLQSNTCVCVRDVAMLDTYNQKIQTNIACTIRTNIDTANLHFIMEKIEIVGHTHKGQSGVIYGTNGISPTITINKGDGQRIAEPVVLGWTRDAKGNVIDRHPVQIANCVTSGKRENTQNYVVEPYIIQRGHGYIPTGCFQISPTITGQTWCHNNILKQAFRIRKLTERECFRLQGVEDKYSDQIRQVVSKSQCYKLAGNSIVVDVLVKIFGNLFIHEIPKFKQLELF